MSGARDVSVAGVSVAGVSVAGVSGHNPAPIKNGSFRKMANKTFPGRIFLRIDD
jgi:hypothetical protein